MEQNEMIDQLAAAADRLASAAETLDRVLGRLDAQQEALNAKVDRIVAAVGKGDYRFSALIVEITTSDPFRMRRGKDPK